MSDNEKRWGYLPDEILTHIFHCLPIKSIIVCTSVSKTWKSLIKNPTFISTHLHHSHKNLLLFRHPTKPFEMFGIIPTGDREVYTLHNDDDDDDFTEQQQHTRLDFTRADDGSFHHFVLVFDLGDEVFRKMLLPELPAYTRERMRLYSPISTYRNSIAFFHQDYNSYCLDIWVMKQYGVVSSWTKALSLTMTSQGGFLSRDYIRRAVGFTRSGKIVLEMSGGHLVSQDLETKETKDLGIIGYKYNFVDAYVESLILLDKAANGVVTY